MITENLATLNIHKLTQEQYNRELLAGNIDENALYFTTDDKQGQIDSINETLSEIQEELDGKSDEGHNHDDLYYTESEIDSKISTLSSSISGKADKKTTLSGYGITDAYTKTEINTKVDNLTSNIDSKADVSYTTIGFKNSTSTFAGAPSDGNENQQLVAQSKNSLLNFISGNGLLSFDSVTDTSSSDSVTLTVHADYLGAADDALEEAKSYTNTAIQGEQTARNTAISTHNTNGSAHNDIRVLISDLSKKVTDFLNVNDADFDTLSELIAYVEANRSSIESFTSGKVNVSDIIDNLTTNVSNKPLSASQGVAIKALIDALDSELDSHRHEASEINFSNKEADISAVTVQSAIEELDTKLSNKAGVNHGNHVPETQTVNNAVFLRNDNTWATVTPSNIGAYTKSEVDSALAGKADSSVLTSHTGNGDIHVTATQKTNWDAAYGHSQDAHKYAGSSIKGGAANSVANAMTIKLNGGSTEGTNMFTFNGSAAKSINITPASIGAQVSGSYAAASHDHDDKYYTEAEIDSKVSALNTAISGKADSKHSHSVASETADGFMSATDKAKLDSIDPSSLVKSINLVVDEDENAVIGWDSSIMPIEGVEF